MKTNHLRFVSSCWLVSFAVCLAQAQQQPALSPSEEPAIKSRAEEVILDVVVRDKKGHSVTDLKPDDFRVLDNGTEKKITSFRLVRGAEAFASPGSAPTHLDPLRQVRLVTLIFQCWSNDARKLARDAASDLIKGELPQNVYMAVMTIDHKLEVLQPYTNNLSLLHKAVDRATRTEVKDYSADTAAVEQQLRELLGPNTSGALSPLQQADNMTTQASSMAQGRAPSGDAFVSAAMAQVVLQMLETQQTSAASEGGRIDIFALLDAVREQYRLPGRKTVLYFSEGGFKIPQGMEQPFQNVISTANRSNVSFYSIDTRGLSTSSPNLDAISSLSSTAERAQTQFNDVGQREVSAREEAERAKMPDKTLESTRNNTQTTLANLSESTGGSLIANTNDLKAPLRRIEEDIQTYYEIAYSPEIKSYDGSFHTISVRMNASDLRVQSRSGYFALNPRVASAAGNLAAYEVPLLSALNLDRLPRDFEFQSATMHFRGQSNQPVCVLAIDVPFSSLRFQPKGNDSFEGRLAYVALLKNEKGEVVKKFRNEIPLTIPSAKMQALKVSHFIYTEYFDIVPGRYQVETAVLDSGGDNRTSARKSSLIVPASDSGLALSTVSFVRNMNDKGAATSADDPLLFGSKVISPALRPIVLKGTNIGLPFYMVAYTNKSASAAPRLIMEFSKDGQVLGQAQPELGQPDNAGRIQYVGTVPTASLDPGEYTIRFIVQQGTENAEEAAFFTVQ